MKQPLRSSVNFLITGGPTREWIDPVRFISNASSGKMGYALVEAALEYTDNVCFIHGPLSINIDSLSCKKIPVETTVEMRDRVLENLQNKTVLIMAAAPADYMPVKKAENKIKKNSDTLSIDCVKTPDILKSVYKARYEDNALSDIHVVGFAAETDNAEGYALGKLEAKGLDAICVNDLSKKGAGFNVDTNIISIFFKNGKRVDIPLMSKKDAANEIILSVLETFNLLK